MFARKPKLTVAATAEAPAEAPDLHALEARKASLRRTAREAESEIQRMQDEAWLAQNGDDALDRAADALLDGTEYVQPLAVAERIAELRQQIAVTRRALERLEPRIAAARREQHRKVNAAARPAHNEAVREVARALALLVRANREEARTRGALAGNATQYFAGFPGIGDADDPRQNSPAYWWFKQAVERGVLTRQERDALLSTGETPK